MNLELLNLVLLSPSHSQTPDPVAGPLPYELEEPGPKVITIPTLDISSENHRHVVIAAGTDQIYQGHASTLLMPDGKMMFCVWSYEHGGPCGPLKRSDDGGLTWSELLPVPESWGQVRNCPKIHRTVDPLGKERLIVFAGNGRMHQSISENGGRGWTDMIPNDLRCVVAPQTVLPVEGGKKHRMWYHRGREGLTEGQDRSPVGVYQSTSTDGGLTWDETQRICEIQDAFPCEPAVIRSPDGQQLLMILRENTRRYNSLMMTSDDEGQTWSSPREAPPSLTGDCHQLRYLPDGRLVAVFRDMNEGSLTHGHFIGWVGRYEDVLAGHQGQYRIKLLHSHAGRDCGYGCLERLPDGTMIATTYVKYEPGPKKHSVVSVRFRIEELDAKLEGP